MTRYVDYALSLVKNQQGIEQIEYYLFHVSIFFNLLAACWIESYVN